MLTLSFSKTFINIPEAYQLHGVSKRHKDLINLLQSNLWVLPAENIALAEKELETGNKEVQLWLSEISYVQNFSKKYFRQATFQEPLYFNCHKSRSCHHTIYDGVNFKNPATVFCSYVPTNLLTFSRRIPLLANLCCHYHLNFRHGSH